MLDPLEVCAEYLRNERFSAVWTSPGSALTAVFKKDPSELTQDDALTVAGEFVLAAVYLGRGARVDFVALVWYAEPSD